MKPRLTHDCPQDTFVPHVKQRPTEERLEPTDGENPSSGRPNTQADLGEAVAAGPLLVQVVLQQPLTHILNHLDEPQVSGRRNKHSHFYTHTYTHRFLNTRRKTSSAEVCITFRLKLSLVSRLY